MNVPGRKKSVTSVMIFIETVSVLVFRAISFMSLVIYSIFLVDKRDWFARTRLDSVFL